jgi:hypothetical protein
VPEKRKPLKPREKAAVVAWAGGVLMVIAGVSGASTWKTLRSVVERLIGQGFAVEAVFFVLIALASLGGLLIIIGGVLLWQGKLDGGRLLIFLGTGLGLIGLVLFVVLHVLRGAIPAVGFHWVGFVGVVLSIASRHMVGT